MPKQIAQNVLQQLKQIGEDTFEGGKQAVSDTAGKALEQMGVGAAPGGKPTNQAPSQQNAEQKRIQDLRVKDKIRSEQLASKLKTELGTEIEKWRRLREEQLRQRRELAAQDQAEKPPISPLKEPTPARKKGIFGGFFGRRIKSAQQQAQPETVGRRVGG